MTTPSGAPERTYCKPRWVTPEPSPNPADRNYVPGAWFDQRAVDRVQNALRQLRHTKGRWAGTPFELFDWQNCEIVAPTFGWKNSDGSRIIRTLYVEIPRKNTKSTLCSGLALVLLGADDEPGAEVYSVAASKPQAGIVFEEAKNMAMRSPSLSKRIKPYKEVIRYPSNGSFYRVLSKVAEIAHGLNVHGAVIDELHVHRSRALVDAIETGTGAREQPLIVIITTADEGAEGTIYAEKHDRTVNIANGLYDDPSFRGVIWAAEESADPFAEETWASCNPGLGTVINLDYMRKEAKRAQEEPSYLPTFLRLHLNRRMRQAGTWINMAEWDYAPNVQMVVPEQLRGRECYAGLDLASTIDLTALVLIFPDNEQSQLTALPYFWLPEHNLKERMQRDQVPYDRWSAEGFLELTEGDAVDYDKVIERLKWVTKTFDLRRVSHDRWQAGAVMTELAKYNIPTNAVPQTYSGMSAPAKELERKVKRGEFVHGGNPLLRWCAMNAVVMRDTNDNIRPIKPDYRTSPKRVDGVTASVMAVDGWMRRPVAKPAPVAVSGGAPGGPGIFDDPNRLNL